MAGIKLSELIQQDLVDDSSLLLVTNKDGRSRAITWGNLKSEVSVTGAGKYVASGTYENEVLTLNYNQGDPITVTGFKDIDLSSLTEGNIPLKSTGDKLINSALSETSTTIISTKPIQTTEASLFFGETVKQSLSGREVTVTDLLTDEKFLTSRRYYDTTGSEASIKSSNVSAEISTEFQPTSDATYLITAEQPAEFFFANIYEALISSETFRGRYGQVTFALYGFNVTTGEKLKLIDLSDYDKYADFGINDGTIKEVEVTLPFEVGFYANQSLSIVMSSYDGNDALINALALSSYVGSNGTFTNNVVPFVPYFKTLWQQITDDFVLTNDDSSLSADKSWSGLKIQQAIDVSATGVSSIIELPASYNDLTDTVWETVLADKASSAERATFVCYGLGSSYVGLPESIILDQTKSYYIVSNVGASNDINDTMWTQSSWIVSDDDAYNANRFFRRSASTSALAIAADWSEYAKEEDVRPPNIDLDAATGATFNFTDAAVVRNRNFNLYTSTGSILGIVVVSVNDFSGFVKGDTITLTIDKSYAQAANYAVFDAVNSIGSTQRYYVSRSLTLVAGDNYWQELSTSSTLNVGIGTAAELNLVSAANGEVKPVEAIVYKTDPAVSFAEQDGGTALEVDLTLKQDAATAVAFNAGITSVDIKDSDLNNVGTIFADKVNSDTGVVVPNGQNVTMGSTNQRSYTDTTLICEADEWQWKNIAGSHTATINTTGLDLSSGNITTVSDIAIDNSATTSIYSQHHSQQSISFFNMGGLSFGADNGETIDFGFNGTVKQTVSSSGIDMGSTKVTSLADGTDDTDAATVGQSITIGDLSNPYYFDAKAKKISNLNGLEFDSTNTSGGDYSDIGYPNANSKLRFFNSDSIYMTIGTASYASFDIFSSSVQKYSFGVSEFDMLGKPIKNLQWGIESSDAAAFGQLGASFGDAVEATTSQIVELTDPNHSTGYGYNNYISYFGIGTGVYVIPNTDYGKSFFLHKAINTNYGWFMIHESLLGSYVDSSTESTPFTFIGARGALSMSNQQAPANSIWHVTGYSIPQANDANESNPTEWTDETGATVTDRSQAKSARYSTGAMRLVNDQKLTRGNLLSNSDESATIFTADVSSEWFCGYGQIGGGTFPQKKLFQVLISNIDLCRGYLAEDEATALGFKVTANAEAITDIENSIEVIQEADANGLYETVYLPKKITKQFTLGAGETKTADIGYKEGTFNAIAFNAYAISSSNTCNLAGIIKKNGSLFDVEIRVMDGHDFGLSFGHINDGDDMTISLTGTNETLDIRFTSSVLL
jgi:hypothetical protein